MTTREEVWKLSAQDPWHPTILWYSKAVRELAKLPATDPTSWRYQAAIHGYEETIDPYRTTLPRPPVSVDTDFLEKCQHFTWYFLPWHRAYLGFFEEIVRAQVVKLGGPATWALPYWNYSAGTPNAKKLPPAFREPQLPDNSPNALFAINDVDIVRRPGVNTGADVTSDQGVSLAGCLDEEFFEADPMGGDPGFGGPKTGFNHDDRGPMGAVESIPHGPVHVGVGGDFIVGGQRKFGWMISFATAALDPIFWLHHANIDRVWNLWKLDPAHVDTADSAWLNGLAFHFHDASGTAVQITPAEVQDSRASRFSYEYDDIASALPPPVPLSGAIGMRTKPTPEMVGGSQQPVVLTGKLQSTSFAVSQPVGPALMTGPAEPLKTFLNIENVTSDEMQNSYEVFVNLPDGVDPAQPRADDYRAGVISLFGIKQASGASAGHSGSGLHYTLNITKLVERLSARNEWDPDRMRVSFAPLALAGITLDSLADHPPVRVGRVSLYYSK